MTPQWGSRRPWTAMIAGVARTRRLELIAAVVTAAVLLPFVMTPGTAEGVEITLDPASDTIVLGQTFFLTAIIDIPVDQFVSSLEIEVEGPVEFTVPVPLKSGPFDLSDALGVSGQLTGDVAFPTDGFGYGYSFGYGYGYGSFDGDSGFGYGYGFGDGFGTGYGYGDGLPGGGSIVLTIQYTPVSAGSYTLIVRAITSLVDGPPIITEGQVTLAVVPPPPPGSKVTLCHIPPGNPAAAHLITVGAPAVPAHLAHGDVSTTTCPSLPKGGQSGRALPPGLTKVLCNSSPGDDAPALLITVGAPSVAVHPTPGHLAIDACPSPSNGSSKVNPGLGPPGYGDKEGSTPAKSKDKISPSGKGKGGADSKRSARRDGAEPPGNAGPPGTAESHGGAEPPDSTEATDGSEPSSSGEPGGSVKPPGSIGHGKSKGKLNFSPNDKQKRKSDWLPPGKNRQDGTVKTKPGGKWKAKRPPPGKGKGKPHPLGKQKGKKQVSSNGT